MEAGPKMRHPQPGCGNVGPTVHFSNGLLATRVRGVSCWWFREFSLLVRVTTALDTTCVQLLGAEEPPT